MASDPNVLLISIDSLRQDFCSIYNGSEQTTPELDAFAENAAVFERAISPSCWTLQVHASVFTGLYPHEHRLSDESNQLGDHPTLAELLSDRGYSTKSFGQNGWLESGGMLRGFDHMSLERPPSDFKEYALKVKNSVLDGSISSVGNDLRDLLSNSPHLLKKAVFRHQPPDQKTTKAFLDEVVRADKPFCHFLHLNDVHYPYVPTETHRARFSNRSRLTDLRGFRYQMFLRRNRPRLYAGDIEISEKRIRQIEDIYRGVVHQTDTLLGEIFNRLREENIFDNTIIVIFADHGDHLGHGNMFGHQYSVADELIRVPLLIRDPTESLPQGRIDRIVQLNDLYPFLLNTLGVAVPDTNSENLQTESRERAFVHYTGPKSILESAKKWHDLSESDLPPRKQYAVWESPDEKLIWYPDDDRYAGPAEESDRLRDELEDHLQNLDPVSPQSHDSVSPDVLESLKNMGYIER